MRGFPVGAIPISEEANIWSIFIAEIILTFAMNFVTVAALLDDKYSHPLTPYVIGMTVFQGVLAGWHVGAGCMNPARVFAPAVIASGKSPLISGIRFFTFFRTVPDQDQRFE